MLAKSIERFKKDGYHIRRGRLMREEEKNLDHIKAEREFALLV